MPEALISFSRDEVTSFVEHALVLRGETASAEAGLNRESLVGTLRLLPPEGQAIAILGGERFQLTAADFEEVQQAWLENGGLEDRAGRVGGFYSTNGTVAWVTGEGEDRSYRHEHGHAVDKEMGYFSKNQAWIDAVEKEMANRKLDPDRSAYAQSVLPESRTLSQHLGGESFYTAKEAASEAFAEMTNHYYSSYANNLGDMEKVNEQLSKAYPDLWPVYRDQAIPQMRAFAERIQADSLKQVDANVQIKQALAEEMGMPFDREAAMAEARSKLIGEPNGLTALITQNEDLGRVYNRLDGIREYVGMQEQLAKLTGQEFDAAAAFDRKCNEVVEKRMSGYDMSLDNKALSELLDGAREKYSDVARLSGAADGLEVIRTDAGYTIRITGDSKNTLQSLTAFEDGMQKLGIKIDPGNYSFGGAANTIGTYNIPMQDVPGNILEAREVVTGASLAANIQNGVADLSHNGTSAAVHAAEQSDGLLARLSKLPGLRWVAAAAAPIMVLAQGGTAAQAAQAGAASLPVGAEVEALAQGRVVEAALRAMEETGIGLVATEPLRNIFQSTGLADVDPALTSAVVEGIGKASAEQVERLKSEMSAGELKTALVDKNHPAHQQFERLYEAEYKAKILKLRLENDGELPANLPATLRDHEAYVNSRFQDSIRQVTGVAANTPTGINKDEMAQAMAGLRKNGVCGGQHVNDGESVSCGSSVQIARIEPAKNGMAAGV